MITPSISHLRIVNSDFLERALLDGIKIKVNSPILRTGEGNYQLSMRFSEKNLFATLTEEQYRSLLSYVKIQKITREDS